MQPNTSSSSPANGGRSRDAGPEVGRDGAPADALKDALGHIGELKEYASYLVSAKLDAYKSSAVNGAIYAVLGIIGAIAGCTLVSVAVTLLMGGIAWGLGSLASHFFGIGWFWLGPFLVGLVILGGMAAGVIFGLKWFARTSHSKLVAKYENRKRQQRVDFGHDVDSQSREQVFQR